MAKNYGAQRLSDSRTKNLVAGTQRAGRASAKKDTRKIAEGTVRLGAKGKGYNVYDSKSKTWKKATSRAGKPVAKPTAKAAGTPTAAHNVKGGSLAALSGYTRGLGAGAGVGKRFTEKKVGKGSVKMPLDTALAIKRRQDKRNQGRDAAAIVGLTAAPLIVAGGFGGGGVGAATATGRAIAAAASRRAIGSGAAKATTKAAPKPKPKPVTGRATKVTVTDMRNGATSVARPVAQPKSIGRGTTQQRATAASSAAARGRARKAGRVKAGNATAGSTRATYSSKPKKK